MMTRRRYAILGVVLTFLVIWYMVTAKESTRNSEFYRKTASAIDRRRDEGPQAPGPAHKTFLKGGSIRPEEDQKPIDTSPIDDTEDDLLRQIDDQMGKKQDLVSEVEGLDRGLEDTDANAKAGKTAEDIELEKQIVRARRREQEKLKEEVRNQLKHKERERQQLLANGKYLNPNWVGAFEKEQKPVAAQAGDDLELAPDFDPYRDKAAGEPYKAPVPIVRARKDAEKAPDSDPFRDKPADEPYRAPVPVARGKANTREQVEQKSEQQQRKLAKEQEFLEPMRRRGPGKQDLDSEDDSGRPQAKAHQLEEIESSNAAAPRSPKIDRPIATQPELADADEMLRKLRERRPARLDIKRQASESTLADEPSGEGYLADRRAGLLDNLESGDVFLALAEQNKQHKVENDHLKPPVTTSTARATKTVKPADTTLSTSTKPTSTEPPGHYTPAELELSRILALSPIVIFSKSYCPYSKKAKRILMHAFKIIPQPYVVELDKHEHGKELQRLITEGTGRGTVPNIIIDGESLGGGDDVEELWEDGQLRNKIKEMGGRRILSVIEAHPP